MFDDESLGVAALEIGLQQVTVAAVAKHIGVRSSALYRLVSSKDDLVLLAIEQIARTIVPVPDEGTWQDVLRRFAAQTWRLCETYPGFNEALVNIPGAFAAFDTNAAYLANLLTKRGISAAQAGFATDLVGDMVLGTHRWKQGLERSWAAAETGRARTRLVAQGHQPARQLPPEVVDGTFLQRKVDFLITSLEHHWPELPSLAAFCADRLPPELRQDPLRFRKPSQPSDEQ
ncbi:hypothetical protein CCHOA_02285 [Corynebacterium choanae]|uniref:Uncharacterized protein n=1 Tax=Corynebacterium choanae TaxID=1862358 RepID=A0A3G6JA92_9CORY|nr:hypothetical protein CCHOA_02285 [Corynebacterium choanae]